LKKGAKKGENKLFHHFYVDKFLYNLLQLSKPIRYQLHILRFCTHIEFLYTNFVVMVILAHFGKFEENAQRTAQKTKINASISGSGLLIFVKKVTIAGP